MRQIGKVVALAAFLGLFLGISFFGPSKDMPFSQVVIIYAFQYYQFGYTDIVYITTRMLPYLLFLFLFGTYIYKHFCTAGVYVFSRCENRLKWIAKENSTVVWILRIVYGSYTAFWYGTGVYD